MTELKKEEKYFLQDFASDDISRGIVRRINVIRHERRCWVPPNWVITYATGVETPRNASNN